MIRRFPVLLNKVSVLGHGATTLTFDDVDIDPVDRLFIGLVTQRPDINPCGAYAIFNKE